jgi:hypothetical protein
MAYIGKSPTGTGIRQRYYFTATGGETSLSGIDDNNLSLSFTDGAYVDVSLNGVALVAGTDYNTNTANTISGLSALVADDVAEIIVHDVFTVADTVSAKNGGTFSGNVTVDGTMTATSFSGDGSSLTGISSSGAYDLNGGELTLDADGDTTIHADTDDEIDFKVAGTDVAAVTSNGVLSATFRSLASADDALTFGASESSSTLKVRGNLQIIIDSNNNSTNKAFFVAKDSGSNIMKLQENGQLFLDGEGGSDLKVDVRQGSAKHWINLNASTASIADSYNVTSITDDGVGRFTVTINNNYNNAHWSSQVNGGTNGSVRISYGNFEDDQAAGTVKIVAYRESPAGYVDPVDFMNDGHGDLA